MQPCRHVISQSILCLNVKIGMSCPLFPVNIGKESQIHWTSGSMYDLILMNAPYCMYLAGCGDSKRFLCALWVDSKWRHSKRRHSLSNTERLPASSRDVINKGILFKKYSISIPSLHRHFQLFKYCTVQELVHIMLILKVYPIYLLNFKFVLILAFCNLITTVMYLMRQIHFIKWSVI